MINQTIKVFVKRLRLFNAMLIWSLPVPSKVHPKLNFTMNSPYNLLSINGGSENCVCFVRLKKLV